MSVRGKINGPCHLTKGYWHLADPGNDKKIQSLINKARRMTNKRFKNGRLNRRCRLYHLPVEVLCFILDDLPSSDVASVEKAVGSYIGDAYWRSRISTDLFHEVRDVMDETLDWEFLCLKLDDLTDALLPKPVVKHTKSRNKKRRAPKTVFMRQEIPEGLEWFDLPSVYSEATK